MALRLHGASHQSKTNIGLSVFGDKRRDDGVERSFVWFIHIEMSFFERKQFAAILQYKTKVAGCHSGAHSAVIALDQ